MTTMNGGVQVEMAAHNGLGGHRDVGYDNPAFMTHESDYWQLEASGDHGSMDGEDSVQDVLLSIDGQDKRFGFSFFGGTDEGCPPIIDELLPGSPADRADLGIGDEILEVNGNTLENATHADVIAHIQQCVKSRTICLRVKRRTMTGQDPVGQKLKQAYVVANKEQTKAKINGIVADEHIPVHDIASIPNHIPKTNGQYETVHPDEGPSEQFTATHENPVQSGITPPCSEEPVESVQLKKDSDAVRASWGHLFPEDEIASDPEESAGTLNFSELCVSELETLSVDSSFNPSEQDTSDLLVREPSIKQHVKAANTQPIDFDELFQQSGTTSVTVPESYPMTSHGDSMAAAAPEKNPSRQVPREVAVDCPPKFVAASGMKNPPVSQNYHGVNGQATMTNGRPVVNGFDSLPNNHEADMVGKPRDGNNFVKVNNLSKNPNVEPSPAPLLHPVSSEPLFDEKTTPAEDYTNNNKPIDVKELFTCLNEIQSKLNDSKDREDIQFLKQLFHNSDFQQALTLHNQVAEVHQKDPLPLPEAPNAEQLAAEIALSARDVRSPETEALRRIFADPHTKALLHAHDKIATRDPIQPSHSSTRPRFPSSSNKQVVQPTEGPDRIVRIQKSGDPLGATIVNDDDDVIIGRIIKGGMAEKTGLLHEGDQILEINGMDVSGKSIDEISDMLVDVSGAITFRVIPAREIDLPEQPATLSGTNLIHIKALFKYDPEDDMYIPCRELGLSFEKGDILHIINQEDDNWWQAYRDGEDEQTLAGLIPSKSFQANRDAMKKTLPDDEEPKKGCRCGRKKKKKKSIYDAYTEDNDAEDREIYEEVGIYYANPERKRPIVLVGPPSVGIQELKQKLLEDDRQYKAAVPHTSRSKKSHEIDGMDYHFIPKHQFEADIALGKFVEYGELSKSLYGISLDAIAAVINEGKICILKLHPQGVDCKRGMMGQGPFIRFLRTIKNSNLHPYFIFIAPPSLDRLRQQRRDADENLKEEELRDIIEMGRSMEDVYGHYFDCVIIHYDHDRAYADLTAEIERIQREPQWVPIQWTVT